MLSQMVQPVAARHLRTTSVSHCASSCYPSPPPTYASPDARLLFGILSPETVLFILLEVRPFSMTSRVRLYYTVLSRFSRDPPHGGRSIAHFAAVHPYSCGGTCLGWIDVQVERDHETCWDEHQVDITDHFLTAIADPRLLEGGPSRLCGSLQKLNRRIFLKFELRK